MTDSELRALTPEQLIDHIINNAMTARELWRGMPTTFIGFAGPPQPHLCMIGDFVISARFPDVPTKSTFLQKSVDVPPPGGG